MLTTLPNLSRRKLLKALAVLSLVPSLSTGEALAWIHGVSSAFNNGKTQVNVNALTGRSGEWAFLNHFKTGAGWTRFDQTAGPIDPSASGSNLDSNGWPQTTASYGGVTNSFVVPSQNDRPGNYIFTWDGAGTCHSSCGESGPLASCSFTGVIAGNVITISALTGTVIPGQLVVGTGVNPYTIIMNQLTGPAGGAGTYTVSVSKNVSSVSMTASGGGLVSSGSANAGFYSFSTSTVQFNFAIGALGSPYITNVKCFHVDDAASVLAGNTFGTKYKQRLIEANWGVLRFLNMQGGSGGNTGANSSNVTTWATRRPIAYAYFDGPEFRPSLYAGTATLSGTKYSASAPPGWPGLVDKAQVSVVWGTSITSACTLNVAGTGDINILDADALPMTVGNNSFPLAGTAGSYATLTYDAVLNAWIKYGGDIAAGSQGINSGAPYELMLQLCIEVGAHPYWVTPYLAADPATDFMSSLAQLCKNTKPSWMIPRFEGPNENWNTGFSANSYGIAKATVYGYTTTDGDLSNCWYGKVLSVLGQQCATVFGLGNLGTQYQVLCGVQVVFGISTHVFNQNLSSASYVAQAAAPQSPFTKSAASGWVFRVAPSNYMIPSDYGTAAEITKATAYNGILFTGSVSGSVLTVASIQTTSVIGTGTFAIGQTLFGPGVPAGVTILSNGTGVGGTGTYNLSSSIGTINSQSFTTGTDLTKPTAYVATLNSGSGQQNLAAMATLYAGWKTWAQGFGVQGMCGYEGGYSPDYTSGGTSQLDLLRLAGKNEAALQGFTTTNYTSFTSLTGGGFVAEFPSCFQFGGHYPSNNVWSIEENLYSQTPNPPPQLAAIIALNH